MTKELTKAITMADTNPPIPEARWQGIVDTVRLLVSREWRRLLMEPSRVVGVLAQPLLFLAVFGAGFHDSFRLADGNLSYVGFFFPGILGLVVLFSSIYATLTLVDDKRCGFFRLVLIGPGGVLGAVLGKIIATAALGLAQGLLFLPLICFLPVNRNLGSLAFALVFLGVGSLCFALIGVLFAWLSPSPSAFHALMSIILIPMWLLSGAMFPIVRGFFWWFSYLNPMAYLVSGLRVCLLGVGGNAVFDLMGLLAFASLTFLLLVLAVKRHPIE